MQSRSMGEIISTRRKEKAMTQKELADLLNITDKAVSKWERDIACPDTQTIPKLAQILELSVDELLSGKATPAPGHKGSAYLISLILRAVPIAMGTAVRSGVNSVTTFVMLCVAPLNVVKGAMVSVLTMLLYKRVARPLFGIRK